MSLDPMATTQTKARLVSTPGWDKMSSYDRTMVCCRELTRNGFAIPGWAVLRELIGKGSASDISRAKTAYQAELAGQVNRAEAEVAALDLDLPSSISGMFGELWRAAVKEASIAFGKRKAEIEQQLQQNEHELEQERASAQQAIAQTNQLSLEVLELKRMLQEAKQQITKLQVEKDQTEKLLTEAHETVRYQSDRADRIYESSQREINEAVVRLEGVEAHSLREIERARSEASAFVEEAKATANGTIISLRKQVEALTEKLSDANELASTSKAQAVFFEEQFRDLSKSVNSKQGDMASALLRLQDSLVLQRKGLKRGSDLAQSRPKATKPRRSLKKHST